LAVGGKDRLNFSPRFRNEFIARRICMACFQVRVAAALLPVLIFASAVTAKGAGEGVTKLATAVEEKKVGD
jgi:hypothetical protein